jgi:hypothetical protein
MEQVNQGINIMEQVQTIDSGIKFFDISLVRPRARDAELGAPSGAARSFQIRIPSKIKPSTRDHFVDKLPRNLLGNPRIELMSTRYMAATMNFKLDWWIASTDLWDLR